MNFKTVSAVGARIVCGPLLLGGFFLALALAGSCLAGELPRCDLVPGWEQKGPTRTFIADNLFDYMDGNSEGYLIYGFQRMRGVTCRSGESSFVIDSSEMPDPESAYGLFTSNRDPRQPVEKIGTAGQIVPQRAIFVKGSFFYEISATPSSVDHSKNLRGFIVAMEKEAPGTTSPPPELGWFPRQGLDEVSIRLVPQSVLGLGLLKRGYMAKYDFARAFIVKESTPQAAAQTIEKLRLRFGQTEPVKLGDGAFQATDRYLGRLLFLRKGEYLAGFANIKEGIDPLPQASALLRSIP